MMKKAVLFLRSIAAMFLTTGFSVGVAFADSNPLAGVPSVGLSGSGPGSGMFDYVMPQLGFVLLLFVAFYAVTHFIFQQQTRMVKMFISACLAGVLVFDVKEIGPLINWFAGLAAHL